MKSLFKTLSTFSSAPHRMMFFVGVVQTLLVMLWWGATLGGRFGWWPPLPEGVSSHEGHLVLMLYGLFTPFFFGFLFTAGPRWMNVDPPAARVYIPMALGWVAFAILTYAGLLAGKLWLVLALLTWLASMLTGTVWFVRQTRASPAANKLHPYSASAGLVGGCVSAILTLAWLATGKALCQTLAIQFGVWGYLIPVFLTVAHRMVPFFTMSVIPSITPWRPDWMLKSWLGLSLLHGALQLLGDSGWRLLADAPMLGLALYTSYRWQGWRSLGTPILAMLHIGFLWLGIGFALFSVQDIGHFAGVSLLGLAPFHAITIGLMCSLLLAMVTRVTLGHSGNKLVANRSTWVIFWVFQGCVLSRMLAEILPGNYAAWLGLSVSLWLLCFGLWASQYATIYWRPRADGAAG
ncbi:NnrS family protein [Leeia oryzae]|uniref:NnrS family protein n=1 Tax=Leeia oryzae TaxID=356662 RepID=UPI0003677570|nr:NnrS family protein [Leeia oryzae]